MQISRFVAYINFVFILLNSYQLICQLSAHIIACISLTVRDNEITVLPWFSVNSGM